VDLFDAAHDERTIRTSTAEQRHVVACFRHDIAAADELADPIRPDAGCETTRAEWDHVTLGRVEPTSGRVDAEDPSPDAGGPLLAFRPASLTATERSAGERTASHQDEGDRHGQGRHAAATAESE
jgi:hypothetical protein